ncbi:MAG: hypothetical protein INR71_14690, partial [Terriglobus roseus]|nr:hypothetical protein [Terriglobus roseus]
PDLRGAEEMFVPVDDDEGEGSAGMTKAELKVRREREYRLARKQVRSTLEGWEQLFRGDKNKPYFKVGEIVREPGWLEKLPRRELCEDARKQRPKRSAKKSG